MFCVDITLDKKNEKINGTEFTTARVSDKLSDNLENTSDEVETIEKESKLPLWMRIVRAVSGYLGLIIFVALVRGVLEVGISQVYKNAPYFFPICAACILCWFVLTLLAKNKARSVIETDETNNTLETLEKDIQSIYDELGVPAEAVSADVLMFKYKVKKGKPVPYAVNMMPTPYIFFEFKIYRDGEKLCFADLDSVVSIELSELKTIRRVNKRTTALGWNKEEEPTKGIYKPYKMTVSNIGTVNFKPYYILEMEHDGVLWGIYFPPYELSVFEKLTGLTAEENED